MFHTKYIDSPSRQPQEERNPSNGHKAAQKHRCAGRGAVLGWGALGSHISLAGAVL